MRRPKTKRYRFAIPTPKHNAESVIVWNPPDTMAMAAGKKKRTEQSQGAPQSVAEPKPSAGI